jgi:hypothetical protein
MDHDYDLWMTMIEPNIWGVFRGIGVKYLAVQAVQRLSFDEMTLRESEGCKELWHIDFALAKLWPRRAICVFGWIKEPESNGVIPSFRISVTGLEEIPVRKEFKKWHSGLIHRISVLTHRISIVIISDHSEDDQNRPTDCVSNELSGSSFATRVYSLWPAW